MGDSVETFLWTAVLLVAAAGVYLAVAALRRRFRHAKNLDALPPELGDAGAVHGDAFLKQRGLLGAELIRDAKKLPDHEREIVHHALWHAMLLEAASDGTIDAREVRFVSDFFGRLSGRRLAMDTATESAEQIAAAPQTALAEIAKARDTSLTSREHILEGAFLVSLADGELIASEANRLGDIADALGLDLTERHVIYQELTNRLAD